MAKRTGKKYTGEVQGGGMSGGRKSEGAEPTKKKNSPKAITLNAEESEIATHLVALNTYLTYTLNAFTDTNANKKKEARNQSNFQLLPDSDAVSFQLYTRRGALKNHSIPGITTDDSNEDRSAESDTKEPKPYILTLQPTKLRDYIDSLPVQNLIDRIKRYEAKLPYNEDENSKKLHGLTKAVLANIFTLTGHLDLLKEEINLAKSSHQRPPATPQQGDPEPVVGESTRKKSAPSENKNIGGE